MSALQLGQAGRQGIGTAELCWTINSAPSTQRKGEFLQGSASPGQLVVYARYFWWQDWLTPACSVQRSTA